MTAQLRGLRLAALAAIACVSPTIHADGAPQLSTFTLSWVPPTENVDGSPITNLQGYYIYVGDTPGVLWPVWYTSAAHSSFVVGSAPGITRYYAVTAVNVDGIESIMTRPLSFTPQ